MHSRQLVKEDNPADAYFEKTILIKQKVKTNFWSLYALRNENGRHVELKFVSNEENKEYLPSRISSYYKDLKKAISDVKNRTIDTVEPDKIRGGGFLKNFHLKIKGFVDARDGDDLEKLGEGLVLGFLSEFNDIKYEVLQHYARNNIYSKI